MTLCAHELGPRWTEPEAAAPAVRCLFTAFALHMAERRDEALQLLGTLAAGLGDQAEDRAEGPDKPLALDRAVVAQADAILSGMNAEDARGVASRHAYTTPAMMELLVEARRRAGVLAPAQFAWLKLVDRRLWYALHSLGYETDGFGRYLHPNPRVEAIGARDHWAAERAAGGPVIEPNLSRAVEALRKSAEPRRAHDCGSCCAWSRHSQASSAPWIKRVFVGVLPCILRFRRAPTSRSSSEAPRLSPWQTRAGRGAPAQTGGRPILKGLVVAIALVGTFVVGQHFGGRQPDTPTAAASMPRPAPPGEQYAFPDAPLPNPQPQQASGGVPPEFQNELRQPPTVTPPPGAASGKNPFGLEP